jgi:hypothetical protein
VEAFLRVVVNRGAKVLKITTRTAWAATVLGIAAAGRAIDA